LGFNETTVSKSIPIIIGLNNKKKSKKYFGTYLRFHCSSPDFLSLSLFLRLLLLFLLLLLVIVFPVFIFGISKTKCTEPGNANSQNMNDYYNKIQRIFSSSSSCVVVFVSSGTLSFRAGRLRIDRL